MSAIFGIVYTMSDPRDKAVRYIGATIQTLRQRERKHLSRNALGLRPSRHPEFTAWLDELEKLGTSPVFAILRPRVPTSRLHIAEAAEMHRHIRMGCTLFQHVGWLPEKALEHTKTSHARMLENFPSLARLDSPANRLLRGDWAAEFAFLKAHLMGCNPQRWK